MKISVQYTVLRFELTTFRTFRYHKTTAPALADLFLLVTPSKNFPGIGVKEDEEILIRNMQTFGAGASHLNTLKLVLLKFVK